MLKQLESPKVKASKQRDYYRKKTLRKIKKRNKRRLENDQKVVEKQLKKQLTKRKKK